MSSLFSELQMKLKEEEGYFRRRLDQLQSRLGDIAMAKTDMASKLILNEEERLKVSCKFFAARVYFLSFFSCNFESKFPQVCYCLHMLGNNK